MCVCVCVCVCDCVRERGCQRGRCRHMSHKVADLGENVQFDYCCMFIHNTLNYLMLSYTLLNYGPENIKLRVKDVEGNCRDIL